MARERKKSVLIPVLSVIMFFVFVITIFLSVLCAKKPEKETTLALPVMKISLLNTTIEEVNENGKNVKYSGNKVEIFDNGITNFYDDVEIKGRGNHSWNLMDKKSYRIKFDEKVNLFGMGKKRKWALIGNEVDKSLMRNDLAYFMSDVMGGKYKAEGQFVELYVDEEYLGVYYLTKTMEIDPQVVDLREAEGVLVEVDNAYCVNEEDFWEAKNGDCLVMKDVVTEDLQDEVMEEFLEDYNGFLKAISKRDFEKASELVDIESFAKYFLISEFAANPDAYFTSWYLYKDGLDDKIHGGIFWDFDGAFGNRDWGEWEEGFYDPTAIMARFKYEKTENLSQVMCDMLEMPEFRKMVSEMYMREFKDKKELILSHLDETTELIREAAARDAEKWGGDFEAEVSYLREWILTRFEVFEKNFGSSLFTAGAAF